MDYIAEANSTASNQFHGDLISRNFFKEIVLNAIDALQTLDAVKKTLFYGKIGPGFANHGEVSTNCNQLAVYNLAGNPTDALATLHAIIGTATEAGEQLEALANALFNDVPIDRVNLLEETGDGFWYAAVLAKAQGFTFEEAQERNIAKLRKRYPEKFNEYDATVRNLDAERKELMGSSIESVMNTTRRAILGGTPLTVERKAQLQGTTFADCKTEEQVEARHFDAMK